jgi:peptidoglycan/LPS O-acetylase OafA/YrhL
MTGYATPARTSDNLQTLKGLACILVVAYHVVGSGTGFGLRLQPGSLLQEFSESISLLRMPLFTFLSGVLFAMRPVELGGYWSFIRKKLARLYVPAITVGILFFATKQWVPGVNTGANDYRLVDMLLFPYAHFWFIQALLVIMVVVGLAEILGLLSTPWRYAMVLVASMGIQMLFTGIPDDQFFSVVRATYLLPFFVLGIGVQRYAHRLQWNETFMLAVLFVFGVTLSMHIAGVIGVFGIPLQQRTFTALMLSCSGLLVLSRFVPPSRSLALVGGYSFAIYLFHVFFTAGSRVVMTRAGVHMVPLLFAAGVFAGVAGPIFVERLVNRMPRPFSLALLGSAPRRQPTVEEDVALTHRPAT